MLLVIKEVVISNYHMGTNKVLLGRETHAYINSVGPRCPGGISRKIPQNDKVTTQIPNQLI